MPKGKEALFWLTAGKAGQQEQECGVSGHLCLQFGTPDDGMVPPTFGMGLPSPVNPV